MEKPILTIKNLSKRFEQKLVLDGINLSINRGEIIGYIGPNGAGKSTTVKIILGLISDYEGEMTIFGEQIKPGDFEYKRRIGYVPESADLYENLTGREYLTFMGQMYGIEEELLEKKAIHLVDSLGIRSAFDQRISSYSKGMKQKLLIAASIIHNPDILFLDEPLNGLDANSVMVMKSLFEKLSSKGKTIFYSSHIMDVVEKISNRIILLNRGKVIADGSFDQLQEEATGSLEQVFNQLTGFHDQEAIAERMIAIIEAGGSDERL